MKKGRGKILALAIGILIVLLLPVLRIAFLQYVANHRIKGQFDFTAKDAQAALTDAQAVEYAKQALTKAGYDPARMGVVTDQGINGSGPALRRNTLNGNLGTVQFSTMGPDYFQYFVDLDKEGSQVHATVVEGE
jgi:hypothetical protein